MTRGRWRAGVVIVLALAAVGCEQAPAEPPSRAKPKKSRPAEGLRFTAPPTWNLDKSADRGLYRAKYTVPTTGDAKHPATLLVQNLGRTKKAADEALVAFGQEFEVPAGVEPERGPLDGAHHPTVRLAIRGTYRFPLGPRRKGKAAAEVLKENWAGLAAVVSSPDAGHWLFRLVGPADTVAGAKSAFNTMVRQAR